MSSTFQAEFNLKCLFLPVQLKSQANCFLIIFSELCFLIFSTFIKLHSKIERMYEQKQTPEAGCL